MAYKVEYYFWLKCHYDIICFPPINKQRTSTKTAPTNHHNKQTLPTELQTYRPVLTLMPLIFLCPPNAFLTLIFSGLSSLS